MKCIMLLIKINSTRCLSFSYNRSNNAALVVIVDLMCSSFIDVQKLIMNVKRQHNIFYANCHVDYTLALEVLV